VDLSGGSNARALYGLCACQGSQARLEKASKGKLEGAELYSLAQAHLIDLYEAAPEHTRALVKAMVS
jgi:hypothetical protein